MAARLRAADVEQRQRLGAGGAIAQAYAHPIIPLCDPADRRTQLLWGLQDFERRFGRPADGLWLPETGVSPATLTTLIDLGVSYTILAPEQIDGVRASAGDEWEDVDRDSLDTGRAYLWRHPDGSGRSHRARGVRRPDVARGRLQRRRQPRREPARRRARLGRPLEGGRAAAGPVRLGRRALGAPQEVLRSDARLRDARRGGPARGRGDEPRRLPGAPPAGLGGAARPRPRRRRDRLELRARGGTLAARLRLQHGGRARLESGLARAPAPRARSDPRRRRALL